MGKRRNRQPDFKDDGSEDSSESGEKRNTGANCPHTAKGLNLGKYFKNMKASGISSECAACKKEGCSQIQPDEEGYCTMPPALWVCIQCGNQACGKSQKGHAENHFNTPRSDLHCLAIDTQCWNIWCYQCDMHVQPDCRSRLLKIVEFSKKLASSSSPANHQPIPLPSAQMGTNTGGSGKPKPKLPLDGLTRVVGLANLGNTCFFNAVLQCLNQTPFLVKILEDLEAPGQKFTLPGGKWKKSDDSEEIELAPIEGTLEGWGPFTAVLCKTLKSLQNQQNNQIFSPVELLNTFKKKTTQCMDGGQHDSHELLRHLLELVRTEDVRRYQKIILVKECGTRKVDEDKVDDKVKAAVKFYGRQANARLLGPDLVFRGLLVSTLECIECKHSSPRTEPFLDLSLPVMADKPQPPVLNFRRKTTSNDASFDSTEENLTNPQTKNQFKKTEKINFSSSKDRRNRRSQDSTWSNRNGNNDQPNDKDSTSFNNANGSHYVSISEENPTVASQLESDADVEDNTSAPEIVESGYSSEKVSTVASPVSPTDPELPTDPMNSTELNNTQRGKDTYWLDLFSDMAAADARDSEIPLNNSDSNWKENLNSEVGNDSNELIGVSPTSSLIVNPELSSEVATASPLSSPVTSKDSPTSPPSSATDNENLRSETNEIRFLIENPSRKIALSDMETPQLNEDHSTLSAAELADLDSENGIADVTAGLSKVAVSNSHVQPSRYQTKDGDCSIQSCLNQFTALELMSGSNKVGCEACTARENKLQEKEGSTKMVYTPSTKQYLISRVPPILILHLKRFQSQRMGFRKVGKHVTFPMLFDLAPVCKGGGKPKIYSLYGVVVHGGYLHGGHYIAYVKTRPPLTPDDPRWAFLPSKDNDESAENSSVSSSDSEVDDTKKPITAEPPPGRWYYVSDSRLMEVEETAVLESQAYMLFYERIL